MTLRRYSIGRALDCDIVLADASVSRRHAELEMRDRVVTLVDCGSTQGTHVFEHGRARRVGRESVQSTTMVQLGALTLTVGDLIEAIRVKYPDRNTERSSRPDHDVPLVQGSRLIRCVCGVIKPHGAACPGCDA